MKTVKNIVDMVSELDFFAPKLNLRYKSDSDFKTFTSAIISIILVVFFSWVFISSFINMINRDTIKQNVIHSQQTDPLNTVISTDKFMFAVNLNGIDMSKNNRYFNINLSALSIINGNRTKSNIPMQLCTIDQWNIFGQQFINDFNKLKLQQWLCPSPGVKFQLQGKYSSNIFKYMKIGISNCSGVVNGLGCRTDAQIQQFLTNTETFQLNFYFTNKLLNPGQKLASSTFLDDTNYFTFSFSIGGLANIFLSNYQMKTDKSLLPYEDTIIQNGNIVSDVTMQSNFPVNNLVTKEFLKIYLRKSPNFTQIKRSFYKFDELLSYIGGLFGLIALVINVPLYYYNILSFQLSLATDLFSYKNPKYKPKEEFQELKESNQKKSLEMQKIQENKQEKALKIGQEQSPPFSVSSFNFILYIVYAPFHLFKFLGWKKLSNKKLTPFYEAVNEVRKQIDICKILKSLSYFHRVTECLLDEDQRKLLHLFPKKDLYEAYHERKNYKLHKKITTSRYLLQSQKTMKEDQQDNSNTQYLEISRLRKSFKNLKKKKDKISKRILRNLDEKILYRLGQHELIQRVTKHQFKSSDEEIQYSKRKICQQKEIQANSLYQIQLQQHYQKQSYQNLITPIIKIDKNQ